MSKGEVDIRKINRALAERALPGPVRVLQFGEGNFLRAFVDWMVDVMNEKSGFAGSVQVIQPIERGMAEQLEQQDGLYHLVMNGISKGKAIREIRLITSVKGAINPYSDYQAFLNASHNPDLEFIISNTTEAGIAFDPHDHGPDVVPNSFPGKLTAFLYERFRHFSGDPSKTLMILPCELIEKNGETLRDRVLDYIAHWKLDDVFRTWVADQTSFFNTLVDRIVPGFPRDNIQSLWEEIGCRDDLMVMAEPFHLWVIEPVVPGNFVLEVFRKKLPLEQAGLNVKITDQLTPYRTRKVRILNGAHTAMVPVAYLRGLRTVREAVDDQATGEFIHATINSEIIPTLPLPEDELVQFAADVIERFQNPYIRHELLSIALNSISKFQVRVLPSLLEFVRHRSELPPNLVRSLAALILFYRGEWKGEQIPINDTATVRGIFSDAWQQENHFAVARTILSDQELWKVNLAMLPGLVDAVSASMDEWVGN